MPTSTFRTRPPVKHDAILAHVRGLIVRGELAPGARLPTRADLERRMRVSPVTIQRALTQLVEEGFVTVAGNQGTFVAEFPPHLHRTALVFPAAPASARWNEFWSHLAAAAAARSRVLPTPIAVYTGVEPGADEAELARLAADVATRRVAGVVFAADPWPLLGSEILAAPGVPRVAFARPHNPTGTPGVALGDDGSLFFRRAIDRLVARGRRRIALLTVPGLSGSHLASYRALLAEHHLEYQPWRVQVGFQDEPHWAAHLIMLMFRDRPAARPDGLIIADDHLVAHACAGLAHLGLRLPAEVDVVAHANFPLPPPGPAGALPISRLGYDIPAAFDTCLDLLAAQRAGRRVAKSTVIAPLFAEELAEPVGAGAGGAGRDDARVAP